MDKKAISIIKVSGSAKRATLPTGEVIDRPMDDMVLVPEMGGKFRSAPYDNHFCYYYANAPRQYPKLLCTCGSAAIINGYDVYKKDATPNRSGVIPGAMLMCLQHATFGKHADGSS